MNPVILFRPDLNTEAELKIAQKYFTVYTSRSSIPRDRLIIPRYSALPYYKELDIDVTNLGSKLINSSRQFNYIANFEYYDDIEKYTFKTYFRPEDLPSGKSFVVKGKTNSKKHLWNTHCFAKDKETAVKIYCELKNDSLISSQDIIFREYEELITYEILINGLPVTNEYRLFFYMGNLMTHGYYWSCAENTNKSLLTPDGKRGLDLAYRVAEIISKENNFFSLDIAQKKDGSWIVVEVNSGEMSGLSMCDPDILYSEIKNTEEEI